MPHNGDLAKRGCFRLVLPMVIGTMAMQSLQSAGASGWSWVLAFGAAAVRPGVRGCASCHLLGMPECRKSISATALATRNRHGCQNERKLATFPGHFFSLCSSALLSRGWVQFDHVAQHLRQQLRYLRLAAAELLAGHLQFA